ncbi:zincin [Guyanagaster necrorhizus]|uniref:Zincin n=1 Tax=Guyanagaster necrorhizus TaxID=856835 RepID=A0A9P8APD3_9AGAR|nr:zincin [Guyanagaster necrorhizus MCA 3950]KAG7442686.1 zincin [Guyanagaster necrorhizus MCA 3950]
MSDPITQSNYDQVYTEHVSFIWAIDWEAKTVSGEAVHDLKVKVDGVTEVIFDTADLDISKVSVQDKPVTYDVKGKHFVMGSALHVPLGSGLKAGSTVKVSVLYKTTKDCIALQWLDKEQTKGKKFPYLFSQCQAIYMRTLAPVQDTPSVKITYTAKVTSVLPVLLSAIRQSPPSDGPAHGGKIVGKDLVEYIYHQPVPIPSYLIAIASGNVVYRPFPKYEDRNWTSGVWAEPEMIDAAYWEFSEDTCRFLRAEEDIVTSYRFGVYDLLVLPPSFPYGGMENACLTFLTPTLLTGDRTLVDVVAHELTHSFFGNGVTHAHATHFWLNEGWTTYMERLLLQVIHSPADRGFSFLIGYKSLVDDLELYADRPKYQRLVIEFEKGEDPDDAYSKVPYEKGANLILHLERTIGGLDVFLPYVSDYVNTFMGKSITTDEWKAHLYAYYEKHGSPEKIKALDSIDWDAWFYGEGTSLPVTMEYDTSLATKAYSLAERWDASRATEVSKLSFKSDDLSGFNSNQTAVFLERLQSYLPLPSDLLTHLGSLYGLSTTHNAEIRSRFYQLALMDVSSPAAPSFAASAANWVIGEGTGAVVGRMKFCRDIFRAVFKVDKDTALQAFEKEKMSFHPIARKMIEKDLGLA